MGLKFAMNKITLKDKVKINSVIHYHLNINLEKLLILFILLHHILIRIVS